MNHIPNFNGKLLDLCFSKINASIDKAIATTEEDKYHSAINIIINNQTEIESDFSKPIYSFNKANYPGLNSYFF